MQRKRQGEGSRLRASGRSGQMRLRTRRIRGPGARVDEKRLRGPKSSSSSRAAVRAAPRLPSLRSIPGMSGLSDPAPTANSLPAQPSSAPSTDGLRGVKSVRGRRSGGATSTAAAAATPVGPGPRDDGGSGRAFFPVPDAGGGECIMTELSEAERYLLSVRCVPVILSLRLGPLTDVPCPPSASAGLQPAACRSSGLHKGRQPILSAQDAGRCRVCSARRETFANVELRSPICRPSGACRRIGLDDNRSTPVSADRRLAQDVPRPLSRSARCG